MIYDGDNNPVVSVEDGIEVSTNKIYPLKIDCIAGYNISADPLPNFQVECRKQGDVPWLDIETTPISLTPWNGTRQVFEFRLTASAVRGFFYPRITVSI